MITQGKAGLALALELQTLMDEIIKALQVDKQLPKKLTLKQTESVKNASF